MEELKVKESMYTLLEFGCLPLFQISHVHETNEATGWQYIWTTPSTNHSRESREWFWLVKANGDGRTFLTHQIQRQQVGRDRAKISVKQLLWHFSLDWKGGQTKRQTSLHLKSLDTSVGKLTGRHIKKIKAEQPWNCIKVSQILVYAQVGYQCNK